MGGLHVIYFYSIREQIRGWNIYHDLCNLFPVVSFFLLSNKYFLFVHFLFHASGITAGYYPGMLKTDFMIWGYLHVYLRVLP